METHKVRIRVGDESLMGFKYYKEKMFFDVELPVCYCPVLGSKLRLKPHHRNVLYGKIEHYVNKSITLKNEFPFTYILAVGNIQDYMYVYDVFYDAEEDLLTIFLNSGKPK